ncbi:hypothetical protein [Myxococcus phage Mx1]|nr:hypothetical protein [Myxococcus phage Mx1]
MLKIIGIAALVFWVGCTNPDRTRETLHRAGFTNVQTRGYDVWSCSDDDAYATKFTATNPAGQTVSGTVCCGILKNCTIRF